MAIRSYSPDIMSGKVHLGITSIRQRAQQVHPGSLGADLLNYLYLKRVNTMLSINSLTK